MSVSELSASSQNYLKAIWTLQEWSGGQVTPSTVAGRVGVRLSTASDAVRKLTEQGLCEHAPYGEITLTAEGRTHAVAMVRRHRLLETFLVRTLGYRWDQVHDEAESLEHAVSDFLVDRIDERLGYPLRDPHGDPIPRGDGTVTVPEAITLTALGPGRRGTVERIADNDPELLQFFAREGIGVGCVLATRPGAPYSDALGVVIESPGAAPVPHDADDDQPAGATGGAPRDEPLPFGTTATDAVWVTPES